MVVYYDEDNFSIKLYRDCISGELVDLIEVIPIDELLEVWEKHKAEQTEPQTMPIKKAMTGTHRERIEYAEAEMVVEDEPQTEITADDFKEEQFCCDCKNFNPSTYWGCNIDGMDCRYEPKDEPQTERSK